MRHPRSSSSRRSLPPSSSTNRLSKSRTKLSLSGNDMEYPLLLAGANIEASHVTGWHLCSQGNIVDLRTHNHTVATNDRWGGDPVQMAIDSTAQLLRQVNASLATEGANRLARLRVQADQIAVTGAKKDALIVTICTGSPPHRSFVATLWLWVR